MEDLTAELEELEQDATELDAQVPSRKLLREGYSIQEACHNPVIFASPEHAQDLS